MQDEVTTIAGRNSGPAAVKCALLAAAAWIIYFSFARRASYAADDFTVLEPVLGGSLSQSLHHYVRPLEYLCARLSSAANFPLWLMVSCIAYLTTSIATLALVNRLRGHGVPDNREILLCACTPLAAITYFQIDTVSQSLANLFSILLAIACLRCFVAREPRDIKSAAWVMALVAVLCLLSKETSYGLVFCCSALVAFKHRTLVIAPVSCLALLLALVLAWSLTATFDISSGSHYSLKLNPLYWIFAFIFSCAVAISPVPTSLALTGAFNASFQVTALLAVTSLVAIAGVLICLPPVLRSIRGYLSRSRGKFTFGMGPFVALLLIFSLTPSIFFKAGELYASQMLPFMKAALILAIPARTTVQKSFWWVLCGFWILASTINVAFYSVATGYDPRPDWSALSAPEKWIYSIAQPAVAHRTVGYSVYAFKAPVWIGACRIDHMDPDVCLPKDIVDGFPTRRLPNQIPR